MPEPVLPPDFAPMLGLIERLRWRSARTKDRWGKPQIPHQYAVRNSRSVSEGRADPDPQAEADYIELHAFIEAHGRIEKFGRAKRHYLYPGDGRKYWFMSPIENSWVINRMWIADDIERMRKTGQI